MEMDLLNHGRQHRSPRLEDGLEVGTGARARHAQLDIAFAGLPIPVAGHLAMGHALIAPYSASVLASTSSSVSRSAAMPIRTHGCEFFLKN
jgi:hypothetical protein